MSKQFSCRIGKREGMQYKDVAACQEFAEKIAPIFTVGKTAQDLRRLFGFLDFFVWLPGREKICLRFHACLKSANAATVPPVSIPSKIIMLTLSKQSRPTLKVVKFYAHACKKEVWPLTLTQRQRKHWSVQNSQTKYFKHYKTQTQSAHILSIINLCSDTGQPHTLLQRQPILRAVLSQNL